MENTDGSESDHGGAPTIVDLDPTDHDTFLEDVLNGLSLDQKAIPPKYLYDDEGSRLFDEICETTDYYPTRTEAAIFREHIAEMAERIGPGVAVIEPGAGSGEKAVMLIDALDRPEAVVPVDISLDYVRRSAEALAERFPTIPIYPVCADFTKPMAMPAEIDPTAPRLVFFPGSTVGNFAPAQRRALLRLFADVAGAGGSVLLGVDMKKSSARLEAAYDDSAGVTSAFNHNLLARMNRELGANFEDKAFRYTARWDDKEGCVWMGLQSLRDQSVVIGDRIFEFKDGERMHTESSYKFTLGEFETEALACGLKTLKAWTDAKGDFAVFHLGAA
ncbi:MAG: L-histidine N(alpha)-methyltransferase [Phycisphaerae bacterium]|nr:L-histidine N(alpha)-methyltransferase [Phycisphaerae bacterium]